MKQTYLAIVWVALCGAPWLAPQGWAQVIPAITAAVPATTAPARQFWIGVAVENIGSSVSGWLKLEPGQGLVISKVMPGSPAEAAGLQPNDLLIEIDGKPLTGQGQLVAAAQPALEARGPVAKPLALTFLRQGDRHTVVITPQPRPAALQVVGGPINQVAAPGNPAMQGQRVPLKGGGFLEVGPGYRLDLNAPAANALDVERFRQVVQRGQCVIISQTTDLQGHVKNSITVGEKTYEISPATMDSLPPEIRTLAQSLGMAPPPLAAGAAGVAHSRTGGDQGLEKKVQDQQDEIGKLRQQLEALNQQMQRKDATTAPTPHQ